MSVVATQRSDAMAMQRHAVVMQRDSAGMTPHGSALVTQLVSVELSEKEGMMSFGILAKCCYNDYKGNL